MFTVMTATAGGACVGEAHIVTVSGEASGETWKELDLALRAVHEGGGQRVVVDLSGLSADQPAFLEVLLRHVARFRARGGDVVLAHPGKPASTAGLRIERRVNDAVASLLA
jgi:anti-anti-sigma regulatory factor